MITRRSAFDATIQNKRGGRGGGSIQSDQGRVVAKSVAKRQSLSPTKRYSLSISASKSLVIMILSCRDPAGIQYRLVREKRPPAILSGSFSAFGTFVISSKSFLPFSDEPFLSSHNTHSDKSFETSKQTMDVEFIL